jgi:hypothetical protein
MMLLISVLSLCLNYTPSMSYAQRDERSLIRLQQFSIRIAERKATTNRASSSNKPVIRTIADKHGNPCDEADRRLQ